MCCVKYNSEIHHRHSIRLKEYDYSQNGYYFVTICTKDREYYLEEIVNGKVELSDVGNIAQECWEEMPEHFENVILDTHVMMPNHFHGIAMIENNHHDYCRGGVTPPLHRCTLGQIIAYFKYRTTKLVNVIRQTPDVPLWHRNYYEHVIRNEIELNAYREYMINNPLQWEFDEENLT